MVSGGVYMYHASTYIRRSQDPIGRRTCYLVPYNLQSDVTNRRLRESVVYTVIILSGIEYHSRRGGLAAADGSDGGTQVRPPQHASQSSCPPRAALAQWQPTTAPGRLWFPRRGLNTTASREAGLLGLELAGDEVRVAAQTAIAPAHSHRSVCRPRALQAIF